MVAALGANSVRWLHLPPKYAPELVDEPALDFRLAGLVFLLCGGEGAPPVGWLLFAARTHLGFAAPQAYTTSWVGRLSSLLLGNLLCSPRQFTCPYLLPCKHKFLRRPFHCMSAASYIGIYWVCDLFIALPLAGCHINLPR
ncbi:hypothetical protein B0T26DRAFT_105139 [Lasiosphaeria miniovina]|uniref:Uncharacterized protein n=1 Tax=Lasiosphaeria miniovina TaxID=1954250 RepID=A0AA40B3D8_9PEZI|nr:uncharacterized protein B0T26DRAFT_105139 [Lasiosphaeria miniovina]KAK0726840.1 hypothetical protein B0T26DRAFT_105139 [Lasiosphaeria miniovina]